jgi:hypothetical protein
VSPSFSLFISLSAYRYLSASPFSRRCVWSIVAAARVDSLITLSGPSGPLPATSPPPSRPLPAAVPPREKGKKVPKIQGLSPQIVFYECLHVPVGPKSPPTLPSSHVNVTRHPRSPSATSCKARERESLSFFRICVREARNRCQISRDARSSTIPSPTLQSVL